MKIRIVERTNLLGTKSWTIQQKHWLFRWMWADAWENSIDGASCNDTFYSLEDAKKHLCFFDGSKGTEKVVFIKEITE